MQRTNEIQGQHALQTSFLQALPVDRLQDVRLQHLSVVPGELRVLRGESTTAHTLAPAPIPELLRSARGTMASRLFSLPRFRTRSLGLWPALTEHQPS